MSDRTMIQKIRRSERRKVLRELAEEFERSAPFFASEYGIIQPGQSVRRWLTEDLSREFRKRAGKL